MDDLKLFGKSEDQIDRLVQTVFIFSEDIGMKCGVVILKKGKLFTFDEIYLPNQEMMKEVDKNRYTYLDILELNKIKKTQNED